MNALVLSCGWFALLVAALMVALAGQGLGALMLVACAAAVGWQAMRILAQGDDRAAGRRLVIPALFGIGVLAGWEILVRGFAIPQILLPAPSQIGAALVAQWPTLLADWQQTVLKGTLAGYIIGCGVGFLLALAVQQSRFLQRGLLPLGSVVSAIPVVGIAPIMVMWFGFDWQSKAAVVVVMTVFPMLVSTLAGFAAVDSMHRDLMASYAASPGQSFRRLVLPGALPHMFNALKLNSTLALIGAIVAEFFGTPIVGMGFRISTEVARMNVDVVWATILVAALTGSAAYGGLALLEKALTFWHPSQREGRAA
jgi:NitT/TauT family transport system permease protein